MLTIRALHYQQGGHPLLTDVALEIFRGERIGLVGRNGCGKSTLLRLIAGTIEPDQGEVNRHTGITIAQVEQELSTSARSVLDFTLDGDV
ncbi:MAG: ATP-binding cassette domain-containing protein, partial [Candidatus Igneacidithiobacillus chanchocoensis]